MVIVRAVTLNDLDALWSLIEQATYGLTTLQITKEQLSERVEIAVFAFTKSTEKAAGEPYVFVMEDLARGKLAGLCCIFSKTGGFEPFYSYRRVVEKRHSELLNVTQEIESLHLEKIHDGPTEIGSLFLLPEYRGQGRGRLLSLSRFSFIAQHPNRFDDSVIAEMRGRMDESGNCPFWEAIGRHFFNMDFPQADGLSTTNKQFIEELMPQYPIYTNMLSADTQEILGAVHENTVPALAMLEAEGFKKINLIDIFDGGPVVECKKHDIKAVNRTLPLTVSDVLPECEGEPMIVTSNSGGFRAMISNCQPDWENQSVELSQLSAVTLQAKVGETVHTTPLYPAKS